MTDAKKILKNAFIDVLCDEVPTINHTFSKKFEQKMENLIKSQKSLIGLINTTGKRVAAVILLVITITTTTVFSVSALRKPVVEAIEQFFINTREILIGTKAENILSHFPTEVSKIVGTSLISESQNSYVIDDEEKIKSFVLLLSETYWGEPESFEAFTDVNTYWSFDFYDSKGKNVLKIEMCNDSDYTRSKVAITKNGETYHYYISNKIYAEILAFTNRKFYLHDSSLEIPKKKLGEAKELQFEKGLAEGERMAIESAIRDIHYTMERFLLNNVSLLKENDSIYWEYHLSGEAFKDPITGDAVQYDTYKTVLEHLEFVKNTLKDSEAIEGIGKAITLWENSMLDHNIEGLFKAHEYIHDYDYFAFNYPTHYVYDDNADYQGTDDYFGHLE